MHVKGLGAILTGMVAFEAGIVVMPVILIGFVVFNNFFVNTEVLLTGCCCCCLTTVDDGDDDTGLLVVFVYIILFKSCACPPVAIVDDDETGILITLYGTLLLVFMHSFAFSTRCVRLDVDDIVVVFGGGRDVGVETLVGEGVGFITIEAVGSSSPPSTKLTSNTNGFDGLVFCS